MLTWPEWKIKVVFTSICVPECLLHPSAVSNKSGYFKGNPTLFIDEQTPECERNVLSKQRQWPQLCLKWDSGPEESFHTSKQKTVNVCACVWVSFSAHPEYLATVLVVSFSSDTHWKPQKQTASLGFPHSLLLYWNHECIIVTQRVCLHWLKHLYCVSLCMLFSQCALISHFAS